MTNLPFLHPSKVLFLPMYPGRCVLRLRIPMSLGRVLGVGWRHTTRSLDGKLDPARSEDIEIILIIVILIISMRSVSITAILVLGICGTRIARKKKRSNYSAKTNSDYDRAELTLYEEVTRMPPFRRKTLILVGTSGVGRRTLKNRLLNSDQYKFGSVLPSK
jgi:hypothetical protein